MILNSRIFEFDPTLIKRKSLIGVTHLRGFSSNWKNKKEDNTYEVVTDEQLKVWCKFVLENNLKVVWTPYLSSKTLDQEIAVIRTILSYGVEITHFEMGQEFWLPKYRKGITEPRNGKNTKVVEKVDVFDYIKLLEKWSIVFKEVFPNIKQMAVCASHNFKTKEDEKNALRHLELSGYNIDKLPSYKYYRWIWNHIVLKKLPYHIDGVTIHYYAGAKPFNQIFEEDVFTQTDWKPFISQIRSEYPDIEIIVPEAAWYVTKDFRSKDRQGQRREFKSCVDFYEQGVKAVGKNGLMGLHVLQAKGSILTWYDLNEIKPLGEWYTRYFVHKFKKENKSLSLKEVTKKLQFKTRRTLSDLKIKKFLGEPMDCSCSKEHEEDPSVDEGRFGDAFTIYTEDELEKMVEQGEEKLFFAPQADGGSDEWNFIVDVCYLHFAPNESGYTIGLTTDWEERCMSAVRSLDDAFRNKGVHYDPNGVDFKINFGPGQFKTLDGSTVWGDAFRGSGSGIRYSGTGGTPNAPDSSDVMEYIKKNVMNSWGDPNRYLIVVFPKINGSASISGYAWVAVNATHNIAGCFVKHGHLGHKDYMENPHFGMENKTTIHELGHSLGLFHTHHNTDSCDSETHPLLQGDRIEDTPPHTRYNSCGFAADENPLNNHMSYSWHTRRKVFTPGQKDRGQAIAQNNYADMKNNPKYNWETNQEIQGCTNPNAINYNPDATVDDGSCIMPIPGCTNPNAINYNSNANQDDGSCEFVSDGEVLLRQGDTVHDSIYDRKQNAWVVMKVTFPENPEGGLFSAGGSGRGTLVGFSEVEGDFVARAGEGGSVVTDKAAIIRTPISTFAGKTGLLRFDIFRELGAIRLRFDEGETGEWDFDEQVTAPQGILEFSGGDEGGIGKVVNSVAGNEIEGPGEFNGIIDYARFSQNNNDDQYILPTPPPIELEPGTYTMIIEEGGKIIIEKI